MQSPSDLHAWRGVAEATGDFFASFVPLSTLSTLPDPRRSGMSPSLFQLLNKLSRISRDFGFGRCPIDQHENIASCFGWQRWGRVRNGNPKKQAHYANVDI